VCRIARLFFLQRLKENMSGDERDFNNMKAVVITFFPPARQRAKEIHAILTETLGKHAPSYATVKN